ncbi:MAG TPA: class I SAM-dependent methyltransferase [Myxococcota bacterium]|nr:class I SAM-dependent methyltransferase [Myxococcota bacterium]
MRSRISGAEDAKDYVPAAPQLWMYDFLSAVLARAYHWRPLLLRQIDPRPGDRIADVGCGTGTQLALLARACKPLTLIGIDPDPPVIERAVRKLARTGVPALFLRGYARDTERLLGGRPVDKVLSSLVFHQVPLEEKRAGLASMHAALVPGGTLHVADYGLQRTPKMRRRFRIVQKGDGFENTEPNARGVLPELMISVGFRDVQEAHVVETPTGSISIYRALRAEPEGSRPRRG